MGLPKGHFTHIFVDEAAQVYIAAYITTCVSICTKVKISVLSNIYLILLLFQALECEALVPLTLADESTKIILAGDHMQVNKLYFAMNVHSRIIRSAN